MQTQNSQRRTVVVTGSNKGIGYSIIELLLKGANVYTIILTARNLDLGNKALEELHSKYKNSASEVVFRQLDVSDNKSVADFGEWIKGAYGKVDALVNNAGLGSTGKTTLEQKAEIIDTNLFGLINLTNTLLPLLSNEGKIIGLSSPLAILNLQAKEIRDFLDDENLSEKSFNYLLNKFYEFTKKGTHTELGFSEDVYFATKAILNTYTRFILTKKLKGDQQAFAACPGWCRTDMGGSDAHRSVEEGADTPAYLVELPWKRDDRLNGQYIRDRKPVGDYRRDTYGLPWEVSKE